MSSEKKETQDKKKRLHSTLEDFLVAKPSKVSKSRCIESEDEDEVECIEKEESPPSKKLKPEIKPNPQKSKDDEENEIESLQSVAKKPKMSSPIGVDLSISKANAQLNDEFSEFCAKNDGSSLTLPKIPQASTIKGPLGKKLLLTTKDKLPSDLVFHLLSSGKNSYDFSHFDPTKFNTEECGKILGALEEKYATKYESRDDDIKHLEKVWKPFFLEKEMEIIAICSRQIIKIRKYKQKLRADEAKEKLEKENSKKTAEKIAKSPKDPKKNEKTVENSPKDAKKNEKIVENSPKTPKKEEISKPDPNFDLKKQDVAWHKIREIISRIDRLIHNFLNYSWSLDDFQGKQREFQKFVMELEKKRSSAEKTHEEESKKNDAEWEKLTNYDEKLQLKHFLKRFGPLEGKESFEQRKEVVDFNKTLGQKLSSENLELMKLNSKISATSATSSSSSETAKKSKPKTKEEEEEDYLLNFNL